MNGSKVIHRYTVCVQDVYVLSVPEGAEFISAAPSRGGGEYQLDVWAIVDAAPRLFTGVNIAIVGTGNPMPPMPPGELKFIDTCVMPSGLVWHVFEVGGGS